MKKLWAKRDAVFVEKCTISSPSLSQWGSAAEAAWGLELCTGFTSCQGSQSGGCLWTATTRGEFRRRQDLFCTSVCQVEEEYRGWKQKCLIWANAGLACCSASQMRLETQPQGKRELRDAQGVFLSKCKREKPHTLISLNYKHSCLQTSIFSSWSVPDLARKYTWAASSPEPWCCLNSQGWTHFLVLCRRAAAHCCCERCVFGDTAALAVPVSAWGSCAGHWGLPAEWASALLALFSCASQAPVQLLQIPEDLSFLRTAGREFC